MLTLSEISVGGSSPSLQRARGGNRIEIQPGFDILSEVFLDSHPLVRVFPWLRLGESDHCGDSSGDIGDGLRNFGD